MLQMEDQMESLQGVLMSQSSNIKSLDSTISQLTQHNKRLQSDLAKKCPQVKDVSTMATCEEVKHKSIGDKDSKRKEEHMKNNHVNRETSKSKNKKEKIKEKAEKDEKRDKDRKGKEERTDRSEKSRKRPNEARESDKRGRYRSRSRNNNDVSNGHRSHHK